MFIFRSSTTSRLLHGNSRVKISQCFVAQPSHVYFNCVPLLVSSLFAFPHNLPHCRNIQHFHFSQIWCPASRSLKAALGVLLLHSGPHSLILGYWLALCFFLFSIYGPFMSCQDRLSPYTSIPLLPSLFHCCSFMTIIIALIPH